MNYKLENNVINKKKFGIKIDEIKRMEKFFKEAPIIHNNYFDYSSIKEIQNVDQKLPIICKIHGIFYQSMFSHVNEKHGCDACSRLNKSNNIRNAGIVNNKKAALEKHGDRYDYTKTDFSLKTNKVIITCKIHGDFNQDLDRHLQGRGCHKCGGSFLATFDEILIRCNKIHGNTYDYSSCIYLGFEKKMEIKCKKHGSFWQTPHIHIIAEAGCPTCVHRISQGEIEWLNSLGIPDDKEHRNVCIRFANSKRKIMADGYDSVTNTIYEYYGDYYHGNPKIYFGDKAKQINPHTKSSYEKLYQNTLDKETIIIENGYRLITIWESDWKSKSNESR